MSDDNDGALLFTAAMLMAIFVPWVLLESIRQAIKGLVVPDLQIQVGLILVGLYVSFSWVIIILLIAILMDR